ncbi:MAG: type IX secretion system sortase PorU [Muribaculaceae bacterium]|nr:type IX secretion system sortase PorU [Muribaculaceae bacterium]
MTRRYNLQTFSTIATTFGRLLKRVGIVATLTLLLIAGSVSEAYSFNPEKYATNSVLSSGNWAKVKVSRTGMQFISRSQLTSLGFKDINKVNVYGFGGRMISETLSAEMPDDLPQLPCVRTSRGILFFGVDHIDWVLNSAESGMTWKHIQQPYSETSYYFLSDKEAPSIELGEPNRAVSGGEVLSTYTCRTVHEQDIYAPSNSGRTLLGEDFRSPTRRTFSFSLEDPADGKATVYMQFAGGTTSGWDIAMYPTGGSKGYRKSQNSSLGSAFMQVLNLEGDFDLDGEKLSIDVAYTPRGTVRLGRLDWIEVEWTRELKLRDHQLHIYDDLTGARVYTVAGCSETTQVWDVTDPTRPRSVATTLNGDKLQIPAVGTREFIVFDPEGGYNVALAGKVSNQDIHGLPVPDMVIISPSEYTSAARRLATIHEKEGMTVHVLTPESLYNEFSSGTPDVSAFRKAFKMWQDRGGNPERISYCVIFSRPTYDNKMVTEKVKSAGYPRVPIWQCPSGYSESSSYSTDDVIGMIDDPKTAGIEGQKIRVAIGRFPVMSAAEADQAVAKLEKYVNEPDYGSWRNRVMIVADDNDNAVHLEQGEDVYKQMRAGGNGEHIDYERLYLDAYPLDYTGRGPVYTQPKERMLSKIDEGILYMDYIGHANPYFWGHENLFLWNDMMEMSNKHLPVLYAATCEYMRWDADDRSGGEMMWLKEKGGIIAGIIPSRTVLITSNGVLNTNTSRRLFERDNEGKPKRLGQIYVEGKNSYVSTNTLRYGFIGDPALRLATATENVELESIAGTEVSAIESGDYPVIQARQKVEISGRVTDSEGNILEGFNGTLHIQLLDAEKPITTLGNGNQETAKIKTYNDRKTLLYTGSTTVKAGRWSTTIMMPSEIENNYSPARISFYAYSEEGKEANGSCEKFYIYGSDMTAPEDTKGPEIKMFVLNREDNREGCVVHTTPVVLASFSDESGINTSNAGIGHKLRLTLDGKTTFDDLNQHYTPDPFDYLGGSVVYPMPELTPGAHTLKLTVWDNANNCSTREISFNVSATKNPSIYELTTDCNPASTSVTFSVGTDRPMSKVGCIIDVFDLSGRKVWSRQTDSETDLGSNISMTWNLTDFNGHRVERGIYLYRATIISPDGAETTETKKLAVTAP